ncbi:McrB family protein [Nocardioides sp. Root140]|uniref:McrB family protein n=1 Tax=Nocardioides sp. Root140 TaxID=1736460 RepID=UPI0006FD11F4|nr:hypothetical protein [Nocardioides sp. Root140]KQY62394.1 chromosome partitioning protein ParA [Nocardioides sp. Root140]
MTDEPQEEATTEPVDETAGDAPLDSDVDTIVEEARQASEHLRLVQNGHREGLEQVRALLQDADGITGITGDLLAELTRTADAVTADRQRLEREKAALVTRALAVSQAEHQRDEGFAEQRAIVERELAERRASALAAVEKELAEARSTRLAEVTASESAERERIKAEIAKERTDWDEVRTPQQEDLKQQRDELEKQKGAISALQSVLEGRRVALGGEELDLESRTQRLMRQIQKRRDNLDEDVAAFVTEERRSFETSQQTAAEEAARLRSTIQSQTSLLGAFEHLQQQLGGREPGKVILELNEKSDEIKRLTEELATRPTEEARARLGAMESENRTLQNRIDQLASEVAQHQALAAQANDLKLKNSNLDAANKSLEQKAKIFEAAANEAETELNRLRAAYERPADVEARYGEIELPRIKVEDINLDTQGDISESEWLRGVAQECDNYGLHFNSRILKAFHTALKTAEMSPLTVLAGVSGTGKSELPRLYSHFGGLYFEPLSVQPNWDSQESMLGFFNSIDNRFDAQPVLRFLAQSQKRWAAATDEHDGYPGLAGAVCLVLLDEMNLAHPELYFAEFLSKLEQRRGKKKADVPTLPVKIGAGMEPYELQLGRNVLWAGTMNQDETTKSLSDKVLDRANVILFPRPTDLKRRQKLTPLDARNRGDNLPIKTWQSWLSQGTSFTTEEFQPFKSFLEEMNTSLAVAGRAIGHRVLQSVEFYMSNYPDVREAGEDNVKKARAMHVAFEDQLVQKVMPKLRGIDTRGKAKNECLDPIRGQLIAGIGGSGFNLGEDFDLALELGYGQFIWQSANYIKADVSDEPE